MRFRDVEMVRLYNLDYRVCCYRLWGDSGEGEVEWINSVIGDFIVDGEIFEWDKIKCF